MCITSTFLVNPSLPRRWKGVPNGDDPFITRLAPHCHHTSPAQWVPSDPVAHPGTGTLLASLMYISPEGLSRQNCPLALSSSLSWPHWIVKSKSCRAGLQRGHRAFSFATLCPPPSAW
ncbi:hypothetical protein FKM82_017822 [Ascaphus truei]